MAFFHAQAPIIQPIQSHYDHSQNASGSTINDDLDVETAVLIANLALDNLADLMGSRPDSLPPDEAIAYIAQWEQFDQWISTVADAKHAKSIDSALVADTAYLDAFVAAEEAAVEDRIMAELLSLDNESMDGEQIESDSDDIYMPFSTARSIHSNAVGERSTAGPSVNRNNRVYCLSCCEYCRCFETLDTPCDHYYCSNTEQIESDGDDIYVPVSTSQFKHSNAFGKRSIDGPSASLNERVECVSCRESYQYFETLKTLCDHYYCRDCLVALVKAFTRDESLFPLRCCQDPIPVAEILPTLSLELRSLFQQKNEEFSVFAGDRLYCSNPNCCSFLGSSEGRLSVFAIKCPRCLVNTCPQCKEPTHPGEGCGVGALQALAIGEEWQTCPGCNTVVELDDGCNHITCRCGTQFCYLCAALWKTCGCAQ